MFVLKKLISQLFYPVLLCLEILIMGAILLLCTRKQRAGKLIILAGVVLFAIMSYATIPNMLVKPLEYHYPPNEDLILESDSKDTNDQARLIQPIVGDDLFLLVTSATHMPRSIALFKSLGMHPIAAPTDWKVRV
jgi:uncharacterized SAM-binding protein YcdF (DUF218 family)